MKHVLFGVAVVACISLVSMSVSAQDNGIKTKFYKFDNMLINGGTKQPDGLVVGSIGQAKFERLLSLKRSFLPRIEESAEEAVLK